MGALKPSPNPDCTLLAINDKAARDSPVRLNSGSEGQSESKEFACAPGSQNSRGVKGSLAILALALVHYFVSTSPFSLVSSLCVFIFKPSPLLDLFPPGQSKLPVKLRGFREPTEAKASFLEISYEPRTPPVASKSQREAVHTSHPRCEMRRGRGGVRVPSNPSTRFQGLCLSREQLPRTEARIAPF